MKKFPEPEMNITEPQVVFKLTCWPGYQAENTDFMIIIRTILELYFMLFQP